MCRVSSAGGRAGALAVWGDRRVEEKDPAGTSVLRGRLGLGIMGPGEGVSQAPGRGYDMG